MWKKKGNRDIKELTVSLVFSRVEVNKDQWIYSIYTHNHTHTHTHNHTHTQPHTRNHTHATTHSHGGGSQQQRPCCWPTPAHFSETVSQWFTHTHTHTHTHTPLRWSDDWTQREVPFVNGGSHCRRLFLARLDKNKPAAKNIFTDRKQRK